MEAGGAGGASVEMNVLRKTPETRHGGDITRENRHIHMASSFGPNKKAKSRLEGRRDKKERVAVAQPIPQGNKSQVSATHDLTMNSAGLLAVNKPDEDEVKDRGVSVNPLSPPTSAKRTTYAYTGDDGEGGVKGDAEKVGGESLNLGQVVVKGEEKVARL